MTERDFASLQSAYDRIRRQTLALCEPLQADDYGVQSMPDVSPPKWHLGHTSWFFEEFILLPNQRGYRRREQAYGFVFNSYYENVGARVDRARRGLLSRPTLAEVLRYREQVDHEIRRYLDQCPDDSRQLSVLELGLHHEQQHQELLVTDFKHILACNPLQPAYRPRAPQLRDGPARRPLEARPARWLEYPGGTVEVGAAERGFAFDNEKPRHQALLKPFELQDRLVTQGEYLAFIRDGGYGDARLWLSDGWATVRRNGWNAPLYWENAPDSPHAMTLQGLEPIDPAAPVTHLSYYEADAYARWAGARLPTEAEWERAALAHAEQGLERGNFMDSGALEPRAAAPSNAQFFGDAWEWTSSAYLPYPGFEAVEGALGEYNGKFMCNQMVLRGGSCATPRGHIRPSYRNFFPPDCRWQFSGIRLARDPRTPRRNR